MYLSNTFCSVFSATKTKYCVLLCATIIRAYEKKGNVRRSQKNSNLRSVCDASESTRKQSDALLSLAPDDGDYRAPQTGFAKCYLARPDTNLKRNEDWNGGRGTRNPAPLHNAGQPPSERASGNSLDILHPP